MREKFVMDKKGDCPDTATLQTQLTQLKLALLVADEDDKPSLQLMISQMEELVALHGIHESSTNDNALVTKDSQEELHTRNATKDEEYFRFQEEIANLEDVSQENSDSNENAQSTQPLQMQKHETNSTKSDLLDDLKSIEGMKCRAPFKISENSESYLDAMVACVEESLSDGEHNIFVRVICLTPITKNLIFCHHYQNNRCRFQNNCKFSHGEIVPFMKLKDHVEVDYKSIVPGKNILALHETEHIWLQAVVTGLTEDGNVKAEFLIPNLKNVEHVISMENCIPLDGSNDQAETEESDIDNSCPSEDENELEFEKLFSCSSSSLLGATGEEALGKWEQHTKGIGSKLMLKMGYVFGSGLGKNSEGRINPVDAIVLPPGRSLDRCMELKEKAGNESLFSVEKRLLRQQRREELKAQRALDREKEQSNFFDTLNTNVRRTFKAIHKEEPLPKNYTSTSCDALKKNQLNIEESLKRIRKQISKVEDSVIRNEERDSAVAKQMKWKLESLKAEESGLLRRKGNILSESEKRSDRAKFERF